MSTTSAAQTADALRTGKLVRRNDSRAVSWNCTECSAHGSNTAAASQHASSKRHEVAVLYAVAFAFVPAELTELDELVKP